MLTLLKRILRVVLPDYILILIMNIRQFLEWKERNFLENSPQFIKNKIFLKYGIANAQWIETGTYRGITTKFLSENYDTVHSIEPGALLFSAVVKKFQMKIVDKNFNGGEEWEGGDIRLAIDKTKKIKLYNGFSETILPRLLPNLNGDCNFFLDGHYSGGDTVKGEKECPIIEELTSIKNNLLNFNNVTILIDDVRLFLPKYSSKDYPDINYLVNWSVSNNFEWRIEHDIFVMQRILI